MSKVLKKKKKPPIQPLQQHLRIPSWQVTRHAAASCPDCQSHSRNNFSLSCIGEGNGNPLQCSCLENPRDGRTWWAAIHGVAQRWARLKWLSSSSRWKHCCCFPLIVYSTYTHYFRCSWEFFTNVWLYHHQDREQSILGKELVLYYPSVLYFKKQSGTKELLDEGERGKWKSWLKTQHSKNSVPSLHGK